MTDADSRPASRIRRMSDEPKVPSPLVFVDTETTGLDADVHEIWEAAAIVDDFERRWFLPVDLGRADPVALRIGGYHERHPQGYDYAGDRDTEWVTEPRDFAREFADLTRGAHLVGAIPSFDEQRLGKLLRANGAAPEWHYHIIDVEAMMIGKLAETLRHNGEGTNRVIRDLITSPWKSRDLSKAIGVDPDWEEFAQHTALGDARWARAVYKAVLG